MLRIEDTKNMIGITIHGDYEDLKALHRAISDYLTFYYEHQEAGMPNHCYETILGLCYDIRHAYQGDRNIESVDNNHENIAMMASCIYDIDEKATQRTRNKYKHGNLYFNVEVLYPWAIYYLYILQAISDDLYRTSWFKDDKWGYTEYRAEKDLAMINLFIQLLWKKLAENLPKEVTKTIWEYSRTYIHKEYYFDYPDLYIEWLCQYWVNQFKNKMGRSEVLPLLCLEMSSLLDEDEFEHQESVDTCADQMRELKSELDEMKKTDSAIEESVIERIEFQINVCKMEMDIAQLVINSLELYDHYYERYSQNPYSFQCKDELMDIIYDYVDEHGPFDDDSFEEWLSQQLGVVNWETMEW